ncbi:MAG: hypothetical protein OXF97_05125 [Nitrospira sp.]|nr:hypothetical protein [Nitrospira sp.]
MPIVDLFSKRQKKLRGEVPDVYVYDDLPQPLRVQIVHIWVDTLGNHEQFHLYQTVRRAYIFIVEALCREYGFFQLPAPEKHHGERDYVKELINFFLHERDIERCLDVVEMSFRFINDYTREGQYLRRHNASKIADEAIGELNSRFREHGIGYQFTSGQIVRIDSEFIHAESVKPALTLLHAKHYAGARQEFLKAHEHYRTGNAKEALSECLKAFESVMKAICDKKGWFYNQNATAKPLIQACFDNGLIPSFWQSHYSSLRSLLESGVPTGRNKSGGHGQGTSPVSVPNHLVAYMLHMTASAIVFLAEAEKQLP